MRVVLLFIGVGILCSCKVNRKSVEKYYYVEPFKEQEIKLDIKDDSTFSLQDLTGCNQFEFTGLYRRRYENDISYMIFDSVTLHKALSGIYKDLIFPIKNGDTAWIINRERIFIHKQPFIATSKKSLNLQEIRYKKLEEYYIGLLGKKGFVKVFGNGKGKKEAKRRLMECTLPDIKIN